MQVQDGTALMPGNHLLPIPDLLFHHHHNHQSSSATAAAAMPAGLLQPATTATAGGGTERRSGGAAVENQQALRCPRCESSNTKFCYYNNYSLSQPRHFCKACKRYWTRGGTLRNVPVGGGCRKNKRPKKASSTPSSSSAAAATAAMTTNGNTHSQIPPSSDTINPLLYSFPNSFYDLQPQMSSLGLFLPTNTNLHGQDQDYSSGIKPHQFHPQESRPSTFLHDYPQLGSSSSTSTTFAASLLTASLRQQQQQPKMSSPAAWPNYNHAAAAAMAAIGGDFGLFKEVKAEEDSAIDGGNYGNRLDWLAQVPCESTTPFENLGGGGVHESSSSLFWNPNVGGWPDATAANCGSSITPLI